MRRLFPLPIIAAALTTSSIAAFVGGVRWVIKQDWVGGICAERSYR